MPLGKELNAAFDFLMISAVAAEQRYAGRSSDRPEAV